MNVQRYAQRRLNPFRGCANYIHFESAGAITLDGVPGTSMSPVMKYAPNSKHRQVHGAYRRATAPFYPHIIDETAIQSARVEVMMRKNLPVDETRDDTMSTYYIEMGSTSG